MCIDIINICSGHTCISQGCIHYIFSASSFRMRGSDMMGISGCACTRNFTIYSGTSFPGMFEFFQNNGACSFSDYKTITTFIIWTAGGFWTVIPFTQCLHGVESSNTSFSNHTFGSACKYNICNTQPDQIKRFHQCIGGRSTCTYYSKIGPPETMPD